MFTQEIRNWKSFAEMIADVRSRFADKINEVEGQRGQTGKIFAFTLSTCMWCNLGKKWLNENGYAYFFLDVDKIPLEEKNRIKAELRELTGEQPRFPFLAIVESNMWHSGYDPSAWEGKLGE